MLRFRPVPNLRTLFSQIEENTSTKTKRFRLVLNLRTAFEQIENNTPTGSVQCRRGVFFH